MKDEQMEGEQVVTAENFSLVNGGLVDRLLRSVGLITPDGGRVARRAIFCSLITWVPVLILTLVEGLAFGRRVRITFLLDFVMHVRFLVAAPLLIFAEVVVEAQVRSYARYFISSGLVPETELPDFKSALTETSRLLDLTIVDMLLFGLAYALVGYRVINLSASEISSWRTVTSESGIHLTPAGWWFALVSIPIFQFLVYRWLWRLIIWTRFLWRMSGLDLRLVPTHPDLAAGLGFLGIAPATFWMISFALATVFSAILGRDIVFNGASLYQFKAEIFGFVLVVLALNFGPMLVFVKRLFVTKRKGMFEYGALANLYTNLFDRKWLRGDNPEGKSILGSADVQSLADIGAGYERTRNMRVVPVDLRTVILLTVTSIIPLMPLLLTIYPLNVLINKIFEILL